MVSFSGVLFALLLERLPCICPCARHREFPAQLETTPTIKKQHKIECENNQTHNLSCLHFISLNTIFNPDGVFFFFCFWRRYLVNLSSLAPFKGGGFIVSCDAEVRSRHIGGADCDNSHCSWDQQEVSAWDLPLQIVYLWRAERCVFVGGFMCVSRWWLCARLFSWYHLTCFVSGITSSESLLYKIVLLYLFWVVFLYVKNEKRKTYSHSTMQLWICLFFFFSTLQISLHLQLLCAKKRVLCTQ